MYLALFLFDTLKITTVEFDSRSLVEDGRLFNDICEEWGDSLYLGFYDWLRTPEPSAVAGLSLTLHDNRDILLKLIPPRDYIEWQCPFIFRITFFAATIDDKLSIDQDFSTSRCLRANNGSVALLFDASDLPSQQIQDIRTLSNQP